MTNVTHGDFTGGRIVKPRDNGGEPPMNTLEDRVRNLETDIAVIKSNYATKADIADLRSELHKSISSQTKWLAATIIGVAAISLTVAKLIF